MIAAQIHAWNGNVAAAPTIFQIGGPRTCRPAHFLQSAMLSKQIHHRPEKRDMATNCRGASACIY